MPVFLLIIGVLLMVVAVRGNTTYLITLLKGDVLGSNGFIMWILAVIVLVAIGYIKAAKPVTDAFLGLLILVIIVHSYKNNSDLFSSFTTQLKDGVSQNGNCGQDATGSIGGSGSSALSQIEGYGLDAVALGGF